MKPALLLIDLQNDFLAAKDLQPAAGMIVEGAARLLSRCRELGIPVVHVRTSVRRDPDNRMPHWKAADKRICEVGTSGHATPRVLCPVEGEDVVEKQFFSGFGNPLLNQILARAECDTVILAGVHLHGCVRATALDAYQLGYKVWIAEGATGTDDATHGAISRRWLADRSFVFAPVDEVLCAISTGKKFAGKSSRSIVDQVSVCASRARAIAAKWAKRPIVLRTKVLIDFAEQLQNAEDELASLITQDVGKPITMAQAEVRRSVAILHAVAEQGAGPIETSSGPGARFRLQPLGVVGVVTPWNNPLAIPVGRFAPAVLFGNTVVWKPAPAGTQIARRVCELLSKAGWHFDGHDLVQLCEGDHSAAWALASNPDIDGITLSGSLRAGYALQEIANRRHIPFQAEMGGNNAAIVWDDADISSAARLIASAAFGFAGQRCTANRRVIVSSHIYDAFLEALQLATRSLEWGDPWDESTVVGPLASASKVREVAALVQRAAECGMPVFVPHRDQSNYVSLLEEGTYFPPTLVIAADDHGGSEIVQEESFGPVLVIQKALDFDAALAKLNHVRQGLVAALFSNSGTLRERFMSEARAGVLKFNSGTTDADASSPLGGWKASGIGPAEHGPSDREFFCRVQTIYDAQ